MREQNGILIFDSSDEKPTNLQVSARSQILSKYGFIVDTVDGKTVWVAATETDYRDSEARRLGIRPEDVNITAHRCRMDELGACWGDCGLGTRCKESYDRVSRLHRCVCDTSP